MDGGSRSTRITGASRGGRFDRRPHADQCLQAVRLARSVRKDQCVQLGGSKKTANEVGRITGSQKTGGDLKKERKQTRARRAARKTLMDVVETIQPPSVD